MPPLPVVKEEVQSFFDLQKDSKHLTIEKKVEKAVFMAGRYKGYELLYVALFDTKYLKRVLKITRKNLLKMIAWNMDPCPKAIRLCWQILSGISRVWQGSKTAGNNSLKMVVCLPGLANPF